MGLKEKLIRKGKYIWELPKGTVEGQNAPVVLYLSDALFELLEEDALRQAANAATLPGVEKAIYVMPDVHVGYGFPVGGVMATNTETGIISPGSIGYDINCLPQGTKILSSYGYYFPIEEFSKDKLLCLEEGKFGETDVLLFFKRREKKLLELKTSLGYRIRVTADHPILTLKGMLEAKYIKEGERVAVYPFEGIPYEKPERFLILESTGKESKDRELAKRGLLPLYSDNEKLPIIIKLVGYLTGDGNLSKDKVNFYGSKEDLEDIKKDLEKLGFKACGVYTRNKKVKLKGKVYETTENFLYVGSRSLSKFFELLGVPKGKKTEKTFNVPWWIKKLPLWMKRLYIASLFGAEMNKPFLPNGYNVSALTFSVNKEKHLRENAIGFVKEVAEILKEFGVQTREIEEREENGKLRVRLHISTEEDNLYRFLTRVSYEYSRKRKREANFLAGYIRYKKKVREERAKKKEQVKELKVAGMSNEEIAKALGINKRFVERSLYENTEVRIGKDCMKFEEWKKQFTEGEVIWDEVISIKEIPYEGWVYDFTVKSKSHNFVAENFVVSNCGVRLIATNLKAVDVAPRIKEIMNNMLKNVPAGVGSTSDIKLSKSQMKEVLVKGAGWAVEHGFGFPEDLQHIEGFGALPNADPDKASHEAYDRGSDELGTVGSGNHFVEVQAVEQIYEPEIAEKLDIWEGQVMIMVHSGSRGFGHQVCTDYLRVALKVRDKYKIKLPDPQLACMPFNSPEGQSYFRAMNAAANYAFANRQILGFKAANTVRKTLGISWEEFGYRLIYDHAHNIGKVEKHEVDGRKVEVIVHRKGATRAFPPYNPEVPPAYREVGQPVIIPGDMGRASFLLVGQPNSMKMSFGTACHGAGRVMSRRQAKKYVKEVGLEKVIGNLVVVARGKGTIMEEIPQAYKDVTEVVRVIDELGIAKAVARLKPLGTLKG